MSFVACWRSHPRELGRLKCGACISGRLWLHTVHALSAKFRKTRHYTNACCRSHPPELARLECGACKGGRPWLHSVSYPHRIGVLCML